MTFELWDGVSGNLADVFDSEAAALAVLSRELLEHGAEHVAGFGLIEHRTDGASRLVAEGDGLVAKCRPYRAARGILPSRPGDPRPEERIRRLRDAED